MQGSICTELIQRLCEYRPQLSRAVAMAAEVDCLISLASAAREHHYTKPLLTRDNVLHIKQGDTSTCTGPIVTFVVVCCTATTWLCNILHHCAAVFFLVKRR